jgi:hypothetical protein
MTKTMNELLDAEFAEFPVLVAGSTAPQAVQQIEEFAGFPLPESYRDFVARYGGAIVGSYSVFGSGASTAMGGNESSVIEVTNRFRADNWPGSDDALVVSMDHAGNAIMLVKDGKIVSFDHDAGETDILAPTFERFIIDWCLKSG